MFCLFMNISKQLCLLASLPLCMRVNHSKMHIRYSFFFSLDNVYITPKVVMVFVLVAVFIFVSLVIEVLVLAISNPFYFTS